MINQKQAFFFYIGLGWIALLTGNIFQNWEFLTLGIVFEVLGFTKSIEKN